ncbi:MAG: bifunctional uroporphyrinogen-III C-methyltransferase/uroporphyrinogen-III synthase, partial [Actinomycetales bacterium]
MTTRQTRKKNTVTVQTVDATEQDAGTAAAPTPPRKTRAKTPGRVSFVGTGPGDASLLTVRAAELISQADVVITEQPEQAGLVTTDVEIVDGGMGEDGETLTHAARSKLVVKHARTGAHVVRL